MYSRIFLKNIKVVYHKSIANIILNVEKLKAFPFSSGTRWGCQLSSPLSNILLEVLAKAVTDEKEVKKMKTGKEELSICR